ncbi:MAG: hypothetical protein RLZZ74_2129 [Cyanobacteriota bacterium]|jgi:hypothetical protein
MFPFSPGISPLRLIELEAFTVKFPEVPLPLSRMTDPT